MERVALHHRSCIPMAAPVGRHDSPRVLQRIDQELEGRRGVPNAVQKHERRRRFRSPKPYRVLETANFKPCGARRLDGLIGVKPSRTARFEIRGLDYSLRFKS